MSAASAGRASWDEMKCTREALRAAHREGYYGALHLKDNTLLWFEPIDDVEPGWRKVVLPPPNLERHTEGAGKELRYLFSNPQKVPGYNYVTRWHRPYAPLPRTGTPGGNRLDVRSEKWWELNLGIKEHRNPALIGQKLDDEGNVLGQSSPPPLHLVPKVPVLRPDAPATQLRAGMLDQFYGGPNGEPGLIAQHELFGGPFDVLVKLLRVGGARPEEPIVVSERALAIELGCSQSAIHRALAHLERHGLIARVRPTPGSAQRACAYLLTLNRT